MNRDIMRQMYITCQDLVKFLRKLKTTSSPVIAGDVIKMIENKAGLSWDREMG